MMRAAVCRYGYGTCIRKVLPGQWDVVIVSNNGLNGSGSVSQRTRQSLRFLTFFVGKLPAWEKGATEVLTRSKRACYVLTYHIQPGWFHSSCRESYVRVWTQVHADIVQPWLTLPWKSRGGCVRIIDHASWCKSHHRHNFSFTPTYMVRDGHAVVFCTRR